MTKALLAFLLSLSLAGISPAQQLDPGKLSKIDSSINTAIGEGRLPGAVVWVEHGSNIYWKAYGKRSLIPTEETMTTDTIFDAASVTKVLATTPAIMLLVERGQIKLDATVQSYIPQFTGDGKETITIRELLTHTSGLPEDVSTHPKWQ